MADIPSKRLREDKKESHSSTARSTDSTTGTSGSANLPECHADGKVSGNGTKRKQATLDQYWSRKLSRKVEMASEPATRETSSVVETVLETVKCGAGFKAKAEAVCSQAAGTASQTIDTLKYGSTLDAAEAVEIEEYDSDTVAASAGSSADDSSSVQSDSILAHLELGITFDEMVAICETSRELPALCTSTDHTVLFKPCTADERCTSIPRPDPDDVVLEDARWDNNHVRLPYSPQNKLLVNKIVVGRWDKISSSLAAVKWKDSHDVEQAILSYNKYKWDFSELHRYFRKMTEEEHDFFFSRTLPKMSELAVNLPSICTQPFPLLRKQKAASITMSQQQAASLLANAFFCTFPSRNTNYGSDDDLPRLPSINFNNLYRRASAHGFRARHAKLDCLLHYFKRVTTDMPRGTLTFKRQVLKHSPDWGSSTAQLQKLHVTSTGTIEDNSSGMLQVDFANKYVGGGVLDEGCVQEEILFLICPELIVSRLITEELDANESLLVTGAERFSNYTGYGSLTQWLSDHRDDHSRDSWGRLNTQIVAIDAKPYRNLSSQLVDHSLLRELNKAYCGFRCDDDTRSPVATGNWGCGAFGGDLRLKALLQLIATAESQRPVCYFTFGDQDLSREIFQVWEAASSASCTVGRLLKYILEAAERLPKGGTSRDIYQHIIAKCTSRLTSCDADPAHSAGLDTS